MKTLREIILVSAGLVASCALPQILPAAEAMDRRLSVIQTCEPQLRPTIGEVLPGHGQVRLVINVDSAGKLADMLLVDYTDTRYSSAVLEAVKQWQFQPALYKGTAIGTRTTLVFNFETRGQVVSMTCLDMFDAYVKNFAGERTVQCVVPGRTLDSVPQAITTVSPRAVSPEMAAGANGVWVDFYIDETGRPRMAAVDVKENDSMAQAAIMAIEQWRFTPPTSKGRPVTVRASQWFDFSKSLVASK